MIGPQAFLARLGDDDDALAERARQLHERIDDAGSLEDAADACREMASLIEARAAGYCRALGDVRAACKSRAQRRVVERAIHHFRAKADATARRYRALVEKTSVEAIKREAAVSDAFADGLADAFSEP
ncbi:MAG: hypothetical protein HQL38_06955 [Alphaproteobacteria bacterium]|nr:hypothetical protein [Alphaproteobacteria bacterium]MBF0392404.1 hypothetical protein [Alphaproteobacteria bacterium]